MNDQSAIRDIIDRHASAVARGDVEGMLAHLAADVLIFDIVDPLRRSGIEAVRQRATEWVESYEGPITWENRDISIVAGGDVAFCTMLSRVAGTMKTGARIDMWFRKTLGLQRRDASWLVTHDHGSVPFNPESGKPSLGLEA